MKSLLIAGRIALSVFVVLAFCGFFAACGDDSVKQFTVTFDSGGGSDVARQTVAEGAHASKPADPVRHGSVAGLYLGGARYTFDGWYNGDDLWDFAADTVAADTTLTARWSGAPEPIPDMSAADLAAVVAYANDNAAQDASFTFLLGEDISAGSIELDAQYANLTLIGIGQERKIQDSREYDVELLFVGHAGTNDYNEGNPALTLGENVTFVGLDDGVSPLIVIRNGRLTMLSGAKITGHTSSEAITNSDYFSTVCLMAEGALFVMEGGEITGNHTTERYTYAAAGVYVYHGTFIMNGGSVRGNTSMRDGGSAADVAIEYFETGNQLYVGTGVLSGAADIGSLILNFDEDGVGYSFIAVDAGFSGTVSAVNLTGYGDILADVVSSWEGIQIIQPAAGYALKAADIGKFGLGYFGTWGWDDGTSSLTQAISPGYVISAAAGTLGYLVASPQGGGSPALKSAPKSTQTRGAARPSMRSLAPKGRAGR